MRTLYIYPRRLQLGFGLFPRDRFLLRRAQLTNFLGVFKVFQYGQKFFPNCKIEDYSFFRPFGSTTNLAFCSNSVIRISFSPGSVDIPAFWRDSAPHPRISSRAHRKFDAIRFPPRDDLRHSPLRGEETLLPLPFRERVGVRMKLADVNKAFSPLRVPLT